MSQHSRVRRVAKWPGLVACMQIGATWLASLRWEFGTSTVGCLIVFGSGVIVVIPGVADWSSYIVQSGLFRPIWPPIRTECELSLPAYCVALWLPLLLVAIPTGWLFWRDRQRVQPGFCRCGYDLTGNVSGRCPECGAACERAT